MEIILKGISIGVMVSFMIGPIFLGLVDITITKGWKSGLAYILAVHLSDIAIIFAVNEIFDQIDFEDFKFYIGLVGGIVLMLFGVVTYFAKTKLEGVSVEDIRTISGAFMKGISINISNPFVILWWIGLYTSTTVQNYTFYDKSIYYFFILFTIFVFDLMKMRFGFYLKNNLSLGKLSIVKKIVGVSLVIFGIVLFVRVIL